MAAKTPCWISQIRFTNHIATLKVRRFTQSSCIMPGIAMTIITGWVTEGCCYWANICIINAQCVLCSIWCSSGIYIAYLHLTGTDCTCRDRGIVPCIGCTTYVGFCHPAWIIDLHIIRFTTIGLAFDSKIIEILCGYASDILQYFKTIVSAACTHTVDAQVVDVKVAL